LETVSEMNTVTLIRCLINVSYEQLIIFFLIKIKPMPSRKLRTGKAMMLFKKSVLGAIRDDEKKTPVMFLITRTKSSDDISKVSEQIRGSGCKTVGIGEF